MIPLNVSELLLNADAKALATMMPGSPHVVPVSTIKIVGDKIMLVNYFMGQTARNIQTNPKVSLSCWKGLSGYQIKSTAEYIIEGPLFDDIVKETKDLFPNRTVNGVILLTPNEIFDISATAPIPGAKI